MEVDFDPEMAAQLTEYDIRALYKTRPGYNNGPASGGPRCGERFAGLYRPVLAEVGYRDCRLRLDGSRARRRDCHRKTGGEDKGEDA